MQQSEDRIATDAELTAKLSNPYVRRYLERVALSGLASTSPMERSSMESYYGVTEDDVRAILARRLLEREVK